MRFEIIFVRHGESCANVWQERTVVGQLKYSDPELTKRGVSRSDAKYPMLKQVIDKYFPSYSIGASSLLRAQQTAYHMLAKHVKKPINVIPHLSEEGLTLNNIPLSKQKQETLLESIDPGMIDNLKEGKDGRKSQNVLNKASYSSFLKWAKRNTDYFEKGDDDVYRAVIFTHGKLLRNEFPLKKAIPPVKTHKKYDNNDFILLSIGDSVEGSEIPEEPNLLYFSTSSVKGDADIEDECPAERCRIPLSCKKKGGTVRRRHGNRRTLKRKVF